MKELTGGDTIMARAMFKEPIEFKPQFKLILACNDLPEMPSNDGGTWRRVRVVEFPSKFVENPNPENPNEYAIDRGIPQKLKIWKKYFMSLLIHIYPKYLSEGLCEPECVMTHTNKYKDKGDIFKKFFEENLECTSCDKDHLGIQILYETYRQWHTDTFSTKAPPRTHFREYMDVNYGEPVKKKGYIGIRFKDVIDDE